ncbi:type II toxin-antitoxin system Phd/YefM family antitoxin [Oxalobacteraceae bacterium]|nr:type II toxin-antitoxin system Phd/YefM family antitoxin [Oxalobacteraceae bacterium]
MPSFDIHEAEMQLAELVNAAAQGDNILITKAGKPVARLIPVFSGQLVRAPGSMKGEIYVADDFDAPLPEEIQAAFDGK